jgi:hypothetical protein
MRTSNASPSPLPLPKRRPLLRQQFPLSIVFIILLVGFSIGTRFRWAVPAPRDPVSIFQVPPSAPTQRGTSVSAASVITAPNSNNGDAEHQRARTTRAAAIAATAPSSTEDVFMGFIGPDPALGAVLATTGPGKGKPCVDCIFVGVTTCCKTWNRTQTLLHQLFLSNDNMHIIVFDDMSDDDSKARVEALGLTVMQPPKLKNVGLTEMMNLMWRYFYARSELQTMFVVNNDIQISPYRTFEKLNRCLQSVEVRTLYIH